MIRSMGGIWDEQTPKRSMWWLGRAVEDNSNNQGCKEDQSCPFLLHLNEGDLPMKLGGSKPKKVFPSSRIPWNLDSPQSSLPERAERWRTQCDLKTKSILVMGTSIGVMWKVRGCSPIEGKPLVPDFAYASVGGSSKHPQ